MKTYQIITSIHEHNEVKEYFIRTEAGVVEVQNAIDACRKFRTKDIDKLIQQLRLFGFKTSLINLEPDEVLEL